MAFWVVSRNGLERAFPEPAEGSGLAYWKHFLCGGLAGVLVQLPTFPFDTLKKRLQVKGRGGPEPEPESFAPSSCYLQASLTPALHPSFYRHTGTGLHHLQERRLRDGQAVGRGRPGSLLPRLLRQVRLRCDQRRHLQHRLRRLPLGAPHA